MPTDYACHAATERAAQSLGRLRAFLQNGPPHTRAADDPTGRSAGAAVLLAFLDGLHADLTGTLSEWHAGVGHRVRKALGLPATGACQPLGGGPGPSPSGWQAPALVQAKAHEVLTVLASPSRAGQARPGELPSRLNLVEDTFAGALRRMAVPPEASAACAAELAAAAGSLFGIRPAPSPPPPPQPPPPPEPPRHAPSGVSLPAQLPDWTGGLP